MSPQAKLEVVVFTCVGLVSCSLWEDPSLGEGPGANPRVNGPEYRSARVDKIDLLFMIDNSASMADKQKILAAAVPDLVERFTNPICVDRETRAYAGTVAPGASCAETHPGSEREFDPILDIHIGVLTSSLGGHGADSCSKVPTQSWNPTMEDMAHLITRGKNDAGQAVTVDTYEGKGFLNWDPTGKKSIPPGENDVARLKQNFTYMVRGADQVGCGFEASLESWRRFLVDPAPYEKMVPVNCAGGDTNNNCRGPEGVDQVVLQQRKDFLRQDSLLSIIMLSDENDCSVIDGGQAFLALQALDGTGSFHLPRSTEACNTDPWSADCKSCWEVKSADYPECAAGWANPEKDDTLNLRCYEQKRRFGIDWLYPIRRYVDALSESRFDDGTLNPVFCNDFVKEDRMECAKTQRDPSLIFLAGIVGVPWQDLANDPTDLKKGYRPVEQLAWTPSVFGANNMSAPNGLPEGKTLWNMVLGDVDESPTKEVNGKIEKNPRYGSIVPTVDPLDPLMKESVAPRTGTHPITGEELVQPGGGSPVGHPVNGAEWNITAANDLQYACVFELGQFGPLDCALPENAFGCDCNQSPENPLCWNGSAYGKVQYRAKAYPGRRQLAVLKGMRSQAIVASVCPSNMSDLNAADFGYRPAIGAIVDRLKAALQGQCWNQELEIAQDGTVPCHVLEAARRDVGTDGRPVCEPCTGSRSEADPSERKALEQLPIFRENGLNCVCQINQTAPGPELDACVSDLIVRGVEGWCYVDPAQEPSHNPEIVSSCPPANKRIIRFVGNNVPRPDALTFVWCGGRYLGPG
jgi:hypothetical protein